MKCPLCDCEIDDFLSHLLDSHKDIGFYFHCIPCKKTFWGFQFQDLVKHYYSIEHLYKTGKLQEKLANLQAEKEDLWALLQKRTEQVVEIQEILSKRD